MGACQSTAATAPAMPPKTPWDGEKMAQGLKDMESAVHKVETEPLAPAKPFPPTPNEEFSKRLTEWEFDLFHVPYDELDALAYSALIMHPCISDSASKLDLKKMWRYVCEIARNYHARPFHNFRHAVDVVLATSHLMLLIQRDHPDPFKASTARAPRAQPTACTLPKSEKLTVTSQMPQEPLKVAALLISALVHDTDHPGVMNTYMIATKHPLAVQLGEAPKAVLENHHAAMAIALLGRPELDFLCNLPSDDRQAFINLIRENVLNTDVTTTMGAAKQFSERRPSVTVAQFEADTQSSGSGGPSAAQVMCLIIKAADISNPARPLPVYERWIDGVMCEFFTQGDAERSAGLNISMNCDRNTVKTPSSQVGFITFLVAPLYKALHAFSPSIGPVVDQLEKNRLHFVNLVEEAKKTESA